MLDVEEGVISSPLSVTVCIYWLQVVPSVPALPAGRPAGFLSLVWPRQETFQWSDWDWAGWVLGNTHPVHLYQLVFPAVELKHTTKLLIVINFIR